MQVATMTVSISVGRQARRPSPPGTRLRRPCRPAACPARRCAGSGCRPARGSTGRWCPSAAARSSLVTTFSGCDAAQAEEPGARRTVAVRSWLRQARTWSRVGSRVLGDEVDGRVEVVRGLEGQRGGALEVALDEPDEGAGRWQLDHRGDPELAQRAPCRRPSAPGRVTWATSRRSASAPSVTTAPSALDSSGRVGSAGVSVCGVRAQRLLGGGHEAGVERAGHRQRASPGPAPAGRSPARPARPPGRRRRPARRRCGWPGPAPARPSVASTSSGFAAEHRAHTGGLAARRPRPSRGRARRPAPRRRRRSAPRPRAAAASSPTEWPATGAAAGSGGCGRPAGPRPAARPRRPAAG